MDVAAEKCLDDNVDIPQSKPYLPMKLGMEFNSDEEAYIYYNEYAGAIGFSIRKEYVNKNKTHGYVTSRKFTCYKEGNRGEDKRDVVVKKPRKETRTGCLAHIVISRQPNEKYSVTGFEKNHNHPLAPPSVAHMLPSQRKIWDVQAHEIDLADDSGIRPKFSFEYAARQAGGRANLGYTSRDHKNYLRNKRQSDLKHGEASSLFDYFEKRRLEDPAFYFSVGLDDDDLITNIFWVDAKMIVDYNVFGDVVSFDTTYRTNKNYRPFALFVGMNNHRQMVIFGASLLYDETIESFKWLFKKFLEVMSGRKPKTFITDQDPAISKALSLVMPETYHRLCVWHLEKNACKHLNHVFRGHRSFCSDFSKLIYHYEDEEEFFNAWDDMLEKYDLRENEWLKTTYSLRHKWSMAYGRNTFSAGMRSTQLSESFNGSLRGYLKSDLDLVQFFKHFQRAVDDKRYNESNALYDMTQRLSILKVDIPLLKHARDVYTSTIFEMFQDQWKKSLLVIVNSCTDDGPFLIYKVSTYTSTQEHIVIAQPSEILVTCSCKLFEYLGILCRHALKILDLMNIKIMLPSHYILKRWTKEATVANIIDINEGNNKDDPALEVTKRYRLLCPIFVQISVEASESKQGYELAAKYANKLSTKLKDVAKARTTFEAPVASSTTLKNPNDDNGGEVYASNANFTNIKGLKRKEPTYRGNSRPKSFLEKAPRKKKSPSTQPPPNHVVKSVSNCTSPHTPCAAQVDYASLRSEDMIFSPWCSSQQSQVMPHGGFSQLLRESICCDSIMDLEGLSGIQHIKEIDGDVGVKMQGSHENHNYLA